MYVQFIGRVAGTPERKNSKNGNEYYQYRIVEETRFGGSDISTWYTIKDMTPRRIYGIVKNLHVNESAATVGSELDGAG